MRITAIKAWQVDLPLKEGRYAWSDGNFVEVFDSTVVGVETDAGLTGYAECCPLGSAYLPSYAAGVRAGQFDQGRDRLAMGDVGQAGRAMPDLAVVPLGRQRHALVAPIASRAVLPPAASKAAERRWPNTLIGIITA